MWRAIAVIWDRVMVFAAIAVIAAPWVLGYSSLFFADPGEGLEYIGTVIIMVGWVIMAKLHSFLSQRLRNTAPIQIPFLVIIVSSIIIGVPLILFGGWIYPHARYALERPVMEQYIAGEAACPGVRCMDDESGVRAIVWGERSTGWTGACYDPDRLFTPAALAGDADRAADRPPQARMFGGVARRNLPLDGAWIRCSVVYRGLPDPRDVGNERAAR